MTGLVADNQVHGAESWDITANGICGEVGMPSYVVFFQNYL